MAWFALCSSIYLPDTFIAVPRRQTRHPLIKQADEKWLKDGRSENEALHDGAKKVRQDLRRG